MDLLNPTWEEITHGRPKWTNFWCKKVDGRPGYWVVDIEEEECDHAVMVRDCVIITPLTGIDGHQSTIGFTNCYILSSDRLNERGRHEGGFSDLRGHSIIMEIQFSPSNSLKSFITTHPVRMRLYGHMYYIEPDSMHPDRFIWSARYVDYFQRPRRRIHRNTD